LFCLGGAPSRRPAGASISSEQGRFFVVFRYIVRRLLWAAALFVAVTAITYVIFFLIPADPAALTCGQRATPTCVASARHFFGLDKPVYVQYARFLGRLMPIDLSPLHFKTPDLGHSFTNRQSVNEIIKDAAPVSASLVFGAAILWMLLAVPVGVLSALRPRSILDRISMIFVLIGISAHPVWIGLLFAYFIGYKAGLAPITGYCDFFGGGAGTCGGPLQWAWHLMLPWMTFMCLFAAIYVRMIRANVMETLNEDYVRTARAKGAPGWLVLRSHVLRNALLPIVTMLGMDVGIALGNAVFTESVYGLPGLGRQLVNSITTFDLPITMGLVVFTTAAIIFFTLIVDLLYAWIDPRIRLT
jgi:peptide/nickel transport system permease protein